MDTYENYAVIESTTVVWNGKKALWQLRRNDIGYLVTVITPRGLTIGSDNANCPILGLPKRYLEKCDGNLSNVSWLRRAQRSHITTT